MIAEQQQQTLQRQSPLTEPGRFESSFPPDRRLVNRTHARAQANASICGDAWAKFHDACRREHLKAEDALVGLLQILLHRCTVADSIGIGVLSGSLLPVSIVIDCDSSVRSNIGSTSVGISEAIPVSVAEVQDLSSQREQPVFRVLLSLSDL